MPPCPKTHTHQSFTRWALFNSCTGPVLYFLTFDYSRRLSRLVGLASLTRLRPPHQDTNLVSTTYPLPNDSLSINFLSNLLIIYVLHAHSRHVLRLCLRRLRSCSFLGDTSAEVVIIWNTSSIDPKQSQCTPCPQLLQSLVAQISPLPLKTRPSSTKVCPARSPQLFELLGFYGGK